MEQSSVRGVLTKRVKQTNLKIIPSSDIFFFLAPGPELNVTQFVSVFCVKPSPFSMSLFN